MPGTPLALAVTADGTQIWAARKGAIDLVDIATVRRIGERKLSGTPIDMAITDDRAVVVQTGGKVAILDLGTGRLVRRREHRRRGGREHRLRRPRVGVSATTPRKGRRRPASRVVRVVDRRPARVTASVPLGTDGGGGLGVSPDGTHAIVAPGAKLRGIHRKAALVDLAKRRVLRRPPTGGGPGRAIWSPDGDAALRERQRAQDGVRARRGHRHAAAHAARSPAGPAGSWSSPASRC